MLLRHAIGAALRRIRLQRGLTLRDLSAASRVSIPYLSEIERGRKEPSSEILATIARVFGLTLLDLIEAVADEARSAEARPAGSRHVAVTELRAGATGARLVAA